MLFMVTFSSEPRRTEIQHAARGEAPFRLFIELTDFSVPDTMRMQQPRDGRRHLCCIFLSLGDSGVIWGAFRLAVSNVPDQDPWYYC